MVSATDIAIKKPLSLTRNRSIPKHPNKGDVEIELPASRSSTLNQYTIPRQHSAPPKPKRATQQSMEERAHPTTIKSFSVDCIVDPGGKSSTREKNLIFVL